MVCSNSDHIIYLKKQRRFLPIKRKPLNPVDSIVVTVHLWRGQSRVTGQAALLKMPRLCSLMRTELWDSETEKGPISSSHQGLRTVPEKPTLLSICFTHLYLLAECRWRQSLEYKEIFPVPVVFPPLPSYQVEDTGDAKKPVSGNSSVSDIYSDCLCTC